MKLRAIAFRNPSAICRYQNYGIEETEVEDNTAPLDEKDEPSEKASGGIPDDMGNRMPTGGRSGNPKTDKFQGYKISPMY